MIFNFENQTHMFTYMEIYNLKKKKSFPFKVNFSRCFKDFFNYFFNPYQEFLRKSITPIIISKLKFPTMPKIWMKSLLLDEESAMQL